MGRGECGQRRRAGELRPVEGGHDLPVRPRPGLRVRLPPRRKHPARLLGHGLVGLRAMNMINAPFEPSVSAASSCRCSPKA